MKSVPIFKEQLKVGDVALRYAFPAQPSPKTMMYFYDSAFGVDEDGLSWRTWQDQHFKTKCSEFVKLNADKFELILEHFISSGSQYFPNNQLAFSVKNFLLKQDLFEKNEKIEFTYAQATKIILQHKHYFLTMLAEFFFYSRRMSSM